MESGQLFSTEWWITLFISSVVIGLIVNLASAYLKPRLDKWRGTVSERRRKVNAQKEQQYQQLLQWLHADPYAAIHYESEVTRLEYHLGYYFAIGLVIGYFTGFFTGDFEGVIAHIIINLIGAVAIVLVLISGFADFNKHQEIAPSLRGYWAIRKREAQSQEASTS